MLTLRKRIFIIVGIAAGILVSILLLILLFRTDKVSNLVENVTKNLPFSKPEPQEVVNTPNISNSSPQESTQDPDEVYVKQLAGIFVERFNSYSNQNNNIHLEDVIVLSTEDMADWLRDQEIDQGNEYQGVTTNVVASNIQSISIGQAVVLVDVKEVSMGNGGGAINYRSGRVELDKVGSEWKVDGFYWE